MMPSFDAVNYSLRPSKSIQRQLVFEGVRRLQVAMNLARLVYVGMGSIWFTDFVMAHKLLGVEDMVSIEGNEIGSRRATYNSPFVTVKVREGFSSAVLPTLYVDEFYANRPWMVWLDYDYELNESVKLDMRSVIENCPENSIFLVTFDGKDSRYGEAPERPELLRRVLGSVVPDDLKKEACQEGEMRETLADLVLEFMGSVAAEMSRRGGFVPAFRAIYQDGPPMVTVGGVLPALGNELIAKSTVGADDWPCWPLEPIRAPHLTIREAGALQSQLPCQRKLSRVDVQALGFDLEEQQVEAFQNYYRQYPAFAQIIA
ncbi:MAG: O-methyltransferase [Terracidiphilus sp.]|jgi:hypothetical protein